jgi:hypothetical protein
VSFTRTCRAPSDPGEMQSATAARRRRRAAPCRPDHQRAVRRRIRHVALLVPILHAAARP